MRKSSETTGDIEKKMSPRGKTDRKTHEGVRGNRLNGDEEKFGREGRERKKTECEGGEREVQRAGCRDMNKK